MAALYLTILLLVDFEFLIFNNLFFIKRSRDYFFPSIFFSFFYLKSQFLGFFLEKPSFQSTNFGIF